MNASLSNSFYPLRYAVVFLFGDSGDEETREAVKEEDAIYGDILQEDFHDDYYNLTHKAVMGLRWAAMHCSQAKFVVRVDDDVFLNVNNLVAFLKANPGLQVGGMLYEKDRLKVIR